MTNRMKKILAIGLAAIFVALVANSALAAETQVWTTLNGSSKLTKTISLNIEEQLRYSANDGLDLARQHTDLGVTVGEDGGVMTLAVGYRNTSEAEHRPYVGANISLLGGNQLSLDSITRVELRMMDDNTLRGRTALVANTSIAGVGVFASDEVFVNTTDGLSENRASVGVAHSINSLLGVNAFYMLRSAIGDDVTNSHVLGMGLSLSL